MPTLFSDIFYKYGVLVDDSELLSKLDDEEYTELLELFLSKAKSIYFKSCKKNLMDVDNVLKQFNEDIDEQEQWIICEAMKYIWCERQIYKEEKLRDRLTTKDYENSSPGNLLDKLIKLKLSTKKLLDEMIISYSFDNFEGFN